LDAKSKISDVDDEIFSDNLDEESEDETMSMRMGLLWLGIITAIISVLSDIIVETIDGFAARSKMSEVFTSVIIIPYFSNIGKCRLFSFCSNSMYFC
jgi:Ca2+:H+ antiporter